MKLTLLIPAEAQAALDAFLQQNPKVVVEKQDYTQPGPPMSPREFSVMLAEAEEQVKQGKVISLEELEREIKHW